MVSSDAHSPEGMESLPGRRASARRAVLPPSALVNTSRDPLVPQEIIIRLRITYLSERLDLEGDGGCGPALLSVAALLAVIVISLIGRAAAAPENPACAK